MKTNHFFILKKEKNTLITKSPTNPKINSLRNSSKKTKQPKRLHPLTNVITEKKNQKLLNGFNNSFAKEESSFSSDAKFNSGRWNKDEHNKFLKGLIQYGNDWKMVQKIIKTRSSSQSRSHAQKFFLKLKNLIKTAKISTEENDLYEYIFKKNKNALDLNDIKLTEQEKKQLLKIIISSINLFDKNKMIIIKIILLFPVNIIASILIKMKMTKILILSKIKIMMKLNKIKTKILSLLVIKEEEVMMISNTKIIILIKLKKFFMLRNVLSINIRKNFI